MTKSLVVLLALGASVSMAGPVAAQTAGSKPITIVVPASPGGVTDALGRMLAKHFSENLGQPAIVENRAGANNQIAAEFVAKAPNDGTVLFVSPEGTFTANPALYPKLNYDPVKDFTPISGLVVINHALITHPSVPAKSVKDLLELAKQKPGSLNYGTFGVGSSGHLNMEMLQAMAGVKLQAVHYKGATPALTDVVAGHIQMMFISVGSAVPQWKPGNVNFIAVGAGQRLAQLPDIPTVSESGLPGYQAQSWFGLFGPAGMPAETVARINKAVRDMFARPEIQENFLKRQYFESIAGTPQQLADFVKTEEPRWRKVIQDAKVTPVAR